VLIHVPFLDSGIGGVVKKSRTSENVVFIQAPTPLPEKYAIVLHDYIARARLHHRIVPDHTRYVQ
jgi:hypothetical protein